MSHPVNGWVTTSISDSFTCTTSFIPDCNFGFNSVPGNLTISLINQKPDRLLWMLVALHLFHFSKDIKYILYIFIFILNIFYSIGHSMLKQWTYNTWINDVNICYSKTCSVGSLHLLLRASFTPGSAAPYCLRPFYLMFDGAITSNLNWQMSWYGHRAN